MLKDCHKKSSRITDEDWSEIANRYKIPWNSDSLRKASTSILGGSFVWQYMEEKYKNLPIKDEDDYMAKLLATKQEIQKEKRKLFDERLDINRKLNLTARYEEDLKTLSDKLTSIGKERYLENSYVSYDETDDSMVVCLADLHIGAAFKNDCGSYDTGIARDLLDAYLQKVVNIGKRHNVSKVYVIGLGDFISGSIHASISRTNKEDVIEQVKLCCEMISDFVYEVSQYFSYVEVHCVSGNHSRMAKKDEALTDERLDMLIPWFMCKMFTDSSRICVITDEPDTTICHFVVNGLHYVGVHGDYDGTNDTSVAKLFMWLNGLGIRPYCILMGHKHFPAMTDVSGVKVVQTGSLCGSGDNFTREKRLTGVPSQTILICNKEGIEACYPVELKI